MSLLKISRHLLTCGSHDTEHNFFADKKKQHREKKSYIHEEGAKVACSSHEKKQKQVTQSESSGQKEERATLQSNGIQEQNKTAF